MPNPKCSDCDRRFPGIVGGICGECRAERQRLAGHRNAEARDESDEYREAKRPNVEQYTATIEAGGRIFEPSPEPKGS